MIISRSNDCPRCGPNHANSCYFIFDNGDYCFSCHKGSSSPENAYAYRQLQLSTNTPSPIYIPPHTLNPGEFSVTILRWLAQYYIYEKEIKQHKIGYVAPCNFYEESLLFPVIQENNTVKEWQRRFFPSKKFYSSPGLSNSVFVTNAHTDNYVVIVEDYISAIRMGQVANCLCLFGTKLNSVKLTYLFNYYRNILVWLDDDEPGQTSAKQIVHSLDKYMLYRGREHPFDPKSHTPFNVKNICYKQPKELSKQELLDKLKEMN